MSPLLAAVSQPWSLTTGMAAGHRSALHEPTQLRVLDLVGTFVFALSGGLAAVRARLDIFGVAVVGIVTAVGGGILRDTLIGSTPPQALRTWTYLAVSTAAAVLVFYLHPQVARLRRPVLVLDAAGLALFAVTGTRVALAANLGAAGACALGVMTGVGGGIVRDVLLRQIPLVLRRGELYAIVALIAAALVCAADASGLTQPGWSVGIAVFAFALRIVALRRHWSAPEPRLVDDQGPAPDA